MHCIHIINRFKIISSLFRTHPIICYDNKHCFPQSGVATVVTLAVAAFIFNTTEFVPVACSLTLRKVFTCKPLRSALCDHLRMGSSANVIAFYVNDQSVERRKLLICLFVVFIASHVRRFYRGALPFW